MSGKGKIYIIPVVLLLVSCSTNEVHEGHKQQGEDKHANMLTISNQDRLLANIKTEVSSIKTISEITTIVGKVVIDERNTRVLSSRLKGRIDELYFKNPGEYVRQGQAVYSIYSEQLAADQNEYLLTLEQYEASPNEVAKKLADGSKKKLLLWTLSENEIRKLEQTRKLSPRATFYSTASGYATDLFVKEGEYVEIGSPILKLSNLKTLWVEAQLYTDEVKYLKQNPSLQLEFETLPNEFFKGEIVYNNPLIENNKKVNLIRLGINNADGRIKPGMMAYISLRRNEKRALVIPKSALIVESTISVWVEDDDGMFEPRMVTLGIENKNEVEILSGVKEGEKVVVSGAFFLKSESIVRQGGSDMGGMKM